MDKLLNLKSSWDVVKDRLKENDISLTDDDLAYTPGKEEELLDRLEKKLNKSREDVKAYIESVSANTSKAG